MLHKCIVYFHMQCSVTFHADSAYNLEYPELCASCRYSYASRSSHFLWIICCQQESFERNNDVVETTFEKKKVKTYGLNNIFMKLRTNFRDKKETNIELDREGPFTINWIVL